MGYGKSKPQNMGYGKSKPQACVTGGLQLISTQKKKKTVSNSLFIFLLIASNKMHKQIACVRFDSCFRSSNQCLWRKFLICRTQYPFSSSPCLNSGQKSAMEKIKGVWVSDTICIGQ